MLSDGIVLCVYIYIYTEEVYIIPVTIYQVSYYRYHTRISYIVVVTLKEKQA